MIPDVTKPEIEEKSREELIAIIHELMAEIERLKGAIYYPQVGCDH
jgi:hypothetical protein